MTDFSTGEVADKLNVHQNTVINWIQDGFLKARRKGPRPKSPWIVSDKNLEEFVQKHPEMISPGSNK